MQSVEQCDKKFQQFGMRKLLLHSLLLAKVAHFWGENRKKTLTSWILHNVDLSSLFTNLFQVSMYVN